MATTVNKEKKKKIIEELSNNLSKQRGVFFINFKGIKGNEAREIRSDLKNRDSVMLVARKTLAKIAFEKEKINFDPLSLQGEVGFVFGFHDGIDTVKIIRKFEKEEKVNILGGIYEEKFLSAKEARVMAEIPSKEELLAKFLGVLTSPTRGFLQVLQGNTKGLLNVLAKAK